MPGYFAHTSFTVFVRVFEQHQSLNTQFLNIVFWLTLIEVLLKHIDLIIGSNDLSNIIAHLDQRRKESIMSTLLIPLNILLDVSLSLLLISNIVEITWPSSFEMVHVLITCAHSLSIHLNC